MSDFVEYVAVRILFTVCPFYFEPNCFIVKERIWNLGLQFNPTD
jgi:hypothetical protein